VKYGWVGGDPGRQGKEYQRFRRGDYYADDEQSMVNGEIV